MSDINISLKKAAVLSVNKWYSRLRALKDEELDNAFYCEDLRALLRKYHGLIRYENIDDCALCIYFRINHNMTPSWRSENEEDYCGKHCPVGIDGKSCTDHNHPYMDYEQMHNYANTLRMYNLVKKACQRVLSGEFTFDVRKYREKIRQIDKDN